MKRNIKSFFTAILMMFAVIFASYSTVDAETVTDGDVKIDIPEYNSSVGWKVGDVYTATINVNFNDATSSEKIIKINLPMGLRYIKYPAKNPATSGNLAGIEQAVTGVFAAVLDDSTSAVAPVFSQYSYSNEVTYKIKPTGEAVEIKISLTVDEYLYYGAKSFANDEVIKVTASKNGNENLGTAKMGVEAYADNFSLNMNTQRFEKTVLEGSDDKLSLDSFGFYRTGTPFDLYTKKMHPKKVEIKYYYPKGAGIVYHSGSLKQGGTLIDHPSDAYLEIIYENDSFGQAVGDKYYLDTPSFLYKDALVGTYDNSTNRHEIKITNYDDTTITLNNSSAKMLSSTLNVVDSSQVSDKLSLKSRNTTYKKLTDNYYSAIMFGLYNDDLSVKSDQILEFEAGANMETVELAFPIAAKSFKYKINNSGWITLDIDKLTKTNSPYKNLYTFNTKKMGHGDGEYLTNAIIELSDINKGYGDGEINYSYSKPRILARLKDGINSDTAEIKTYKVDSGGSIINNTLATTNPTLTRNSQANSTPSIGTSELVVNAGETKKAQIDLTTIAGYFYQNTVAMINPAVYIKIPKGVNIDKNSVQVLTSGVSNTDFVVSDPYELENGDRYIEIDIKQYLGGYFNDGIAYDLISVYFDVQTSLLSSGNYKWSDYAFLMDKSNEVNVGSIVDANDIDRDNNTTEKMVPSAVSNYIIQEKKELLIDTYIKASATDPREADYDTSKPASAINFTPGTEAIYTVDIYNNRNDSAGTKAKTTAYIPVPKKGLNFGS
ncbi:hypothetical protein OKW22_000292, partial [Bacilli bacterium PM5-3]|nr:hypothetical protein [Bacilli bacterium PM5-3]